MSRRRRRRIRLRRHTIGSKRNPLVVRGRTYSLVIRPADLSATVIATVRSSHGLQLLSNDYSVRRQRLVSSSIICIVQFIVLGVDDFFANVVPDEPSLSVTSSQCRHRQVIVDAVVILSLGVVVVVGVVVVPSSSSLPHGIAYKRPMGPRSSSLEQKSWPQSCNRRLALIRI